MDIINNGITAELQQEVEVFRKTVRHAYFVDQIDNEHALAAEKNQVKDED